MGNGLELLTPEAAAKYLGGEDSPISVETLRWWRYKRRGPAFCRVGARRVMYRKADLEAYVQRGLVEVQEVANAS
ncbi:hypothetical protein J2046_002732 [Rhizobium petrolearium]|uniref:helix-turn-helix transcriptional regulator n=1 Tax=Neorhizobium petrolearium TaxID=515361 RepID=UPI001AE394D0|nr:helix-turn-helix domain-containing protein [Neorhizobium petrolearium]MBP1844473.1 hypothetical protein [Neorhizobium petrolearium]